MKDTPGSDRNAAKQPAKAGASSTAAPLIPMTAGDASSRRRRIILAVLAGAIIVGAGAAWGYKRSTDPLKSEASLQTGKRLYDTARYSEAILHFTRAIELQSDSGEAYLLRARSRVALYDPEKAIPDFTRGIQLRPRDPIALVDRGDSYLLLKKFPQAAADATAALAIEPNLASAYTLRATAARDAGEPEKSLPDWTRSIEITPGAENYFQRGATYQLLGQHRQAIADLDQALSYVQAPQSYYARAKSELAVGDTKAAEEDHLRARALDSH